MIDTSDRLNVWLVEDHKVYGERLMRALNRMAGIHCSHRFTACEDALDALETNDHPQIVLVDLDLPGMNGIDGIPLIRERAPYASIIILTVFQDDDKIFRAICAGAVGYLLKTAKTQAIAAAIRSTAAGESAITPAIARRVMVMLSKINKPAPDYGLTAREKEILYLLVQGHTIKRAATDLGISYYTADEYIRNVYKKLHVHSRGSAVAKAINEKLVGPQKHPQ